MDPDTGKTELIYFKACYEPDMVQRVLPKSRTAPTVDVISSLYSRGAVADKDDGGICCY